MSKPILIVCTIFLAARGYGTGVSLGVQGGYNIHYVDEEQHGVPDIGFSAGIKSHILPFAIVGNANLNWRTQEQMVNVMALSLTLKYHISLPLVPLRLYAGIGVGADWNIGEELSLEIFDQDYTQSIIGLGGVEISVFDSQVYIFGDVRYKHLYPKEGDWNQLLIGVGIAYPFF